MDYLRTLGSAAVSTLVQKSGLNIPFTLGQKLSDLDGVASLYDGTKRDDGSPVSIFEYYFGDSSKTYMRPFASNALRKLRSTRHPDVLKFMDAVETDLHVYIMTERVRPLAGVLSTWSSRHAKEREEWLLWGLHRVSVALTFINDSCASTHGKLNINSIFVSPSGEWKLGGFELFSSPKEEYPTLYTLGGQYNNSSSWMCPEAEKGGWMALKDHESSVADAYALGLLLQALFNPTMPLPGTVIPPHPPPTSRGSIPTSVFPSFKNLLNPNPKARLTPKVFLSIGMADSGFFAQNRLVKICLGLDNFPLASESEKNAFLRTLKESASSFPQEFTSGHVLRSLLSALDFGGSSVAGILPLVLHFGSSVPPDTYTSIVLTPIVKLFASPDRGTRMTLLDHLSEYVDHLDKKTVSEGIFPHFSTGFTDTVAVIRETTVKSVILLSPKLTDRILNNDLLRHLARMQSDPEASIRTNTCILLGRLGPSLGYNTKKKVLVPAFVHAMKDTFTHARVAGLMAFIATIECFEPDDIATKVIPNMAFAMIDKEKLVRDQAFKAIHLYIKKLESHAATMPETVLTEAGDGLRVPPLDQATFSNSAAAASAFAGWAMSSLGKKLMPADLQTTMGITGKSNLVAPHQQSVTPSPGLSTNPSPAMFSPQQSSLERKGMQLGGNKLEAVFDLLMEDPADHSQNHPWNTENLIDIDADDDWSAFESALPAVPDSKSVTSARPAFAPGGSSEGVSHLNRQSSPLSGSSPLADPLHKKQPGGQNMKPVAPQTMNRDGKAVEIARRKEERKQRIALLKEQKKNATKS